MTKYIVSATVTISIQTEVFAETEEEALEEAYERPMMSFCHQCTSGHPSDEWITSGELDGTPENLRAEED